MGEGLFACSPVTAAPSCHRLEVIIIIFREQKEEGESNVAVVHLKKKGRVIVRNDSAFSGAGKRTKRAFVVVDVF